MAPNMADLLVRSSPAQTVCIKFREGAKLNFDSPHGPAMLATSLSEYRCLCERQGASTMALDLRLSLIQCRLLLRKSRVTFAERKTTLH